MSVRLRAIASVVLLVGFFVLLAALIGGLVGGAGYALASGRAVGLKLAIAAIVVLVAVGAAVRKVIQVKAEPHGARVERPDQPELWRMVDDLAVAADTRAPDEVRIVPEVNAAVWERSALLGLRSGRRYLEIGLPLLAGLSVSELRAVLGHELGHFSHGHTTLSAQTYRATMTMERTVAELEGLPKWILGGYARLYALVARSANRAQELQADAAAVRAAGRAATSAALAKLPALDAAWSHYADSYVGLAPVAKRTPDLLLGFNAFLADPARRSQLAELETRLLDLEPASLFDSHPPIRQRIAHVRALPDTEQPLDGRPAWSVLRDPADAVPRLENALLVDDLGPRAPWHEVVRLAGATAVAHNAEVLAGAAIEAGVVRLGTLREILDAVQRGYGDRMVAPLLGPDVPADRRAEVATEALTDLVTDSVVAAMVRAGIARHELNWAGPWRLRLVDGQEFDPVAMVAPVVAGGGRTDALVHWLSSAGARLDDVPAAGGASTPRVTTALP